MRTLRLGRFGRMTLVALMGLAMSLAFASGSADAKTKDGKYLIYYSMSYVGNAWQTEAKKLAPGDVQDRCL